MIPRLAKSSPLALLTPKEAAAALGISPRKLWSLTASGDVPCVRIGRSVRYDAADLAEFVETLKSAK
ncbi:MAG: helix-turn-helix domain-containing protein [Planctomycetaceae bacterium]|nr:helix-turn-helix domain-containing protein [Planctomycetaceae bacterium]